ncbi:MAG: ParB/RepB/Spo0J family partition protein [Phycisphaerales bacterium]|nr:ParB/RepB/Spo0J family partition protein [Phycisphaerae bacterium]NNF42591.1 ParB/RepB/Spo0J family partition protein [Phycisphaerales bacterium]NNM25753.1 ParB/RepB/Spo0J family partition protein [Phycisphaerales bacterium]
MSSRKDATKTAGRRRLGRGLGSLMSAPVAVEAGEPKTAAPTTSSPATPAPNAPPGEVGTVPVDSIRPNPFQPRQDFDEAALATLAESIRRSGLMQPIIVRPAGARRYELIAGERRWRAAQLAGLGHLPAIVRELDDREAMEWALVENLQREDLNPIERAEAFQRLAAEHSLTHRAIAESVGVDRSNVTNHLRLLELDEETQTLVREGVLSGGHGRALLAFANLDARRRLAARAAREGWSVRDLERRARSQSSAATTNKSPSPRQVQLDDLERRLGEHLGTKVRVERGRRKGAGTLSISFFSLDEFEGLMKRLGFEYE